ncbi:MAG: SDR family NAD(P)-dependent oxidoreductase, partial [Anaerolineales bacterium]
MSSRKIALVTGAARGIGSAILQAFKSSGWQVIGIDKQSAEDLLQVDAADPEQVEELFNRIQDPINALINNAAIQLTKSMIDTTPEEWDNVLGTNLRSVFLMSRYAHPHLMRRAGAIVNISSVHAIATSEGIAAYAASKGAVVALTRAMALELAADGIRVNALLPGAVDTPMLRAGMERWSDIGVDELARRTPLGRIGRP